MREPERRSPPVWLLAGAALLSLLAGARAAVALDFAAGRLWLVGLAGLGLVAAAGLAVDAVTRENPARANPRVRRIFGLVTVLAVALAAQTPAVAWRLYEGDPEIRDAKAFSEGIGDDTWASLDEQGLIGPGEDATVLPGEDELPAFVHEHGIWFGVRDGRAALGFVRTRGEVVERYHYDIDRDRWSRTREVAPS